MMNGHLRRALRHFTADFDMVQEVFSLEDDPEELQYLEHRLLLSDADVQSIVENSQDGGVGQILATSLVATGAPEEVAIHDSTIRQIQQYLEGANEPDEMSRQMPKPTPFGQNPFGDLLPDSYTDLLDLLDPNGAGERHQEDMY